MIHNDSRLTSQERRWYQISLRSLLLLAVPAALLACFLKVWLPWLNPGPEDARPSAFLSPLDGNQLESMFRQLVPKGAFFHTTGARSSSREISPQRGKWTRVWDASLVCYQVEADRAMRTFRTDLQKSVGLHGGEIREEQECLNGSSLIGFRFIYIEGEHTGTVEARYGPERHFGTFPDDDPPFRTLTIRIEETTGFGRHVKNNFWEDNNSSPETLFP